MLWSLLARLHAREQTTHCPMGSVGWESPLSLSHSSHPFLAPTGWPWHVPLMAVTRTRPTAWTDALWAQLPPLCGHPVSQNKLSVEPRIRLGAVPHDKGCRKRGKIKACFVIGHTNKVSFRFLQKGEFEHIHPEERTNNTPIWNDGRHYIHQNIQAVSEGSQ